jgi:hypothetical protein
MFPGGLSGITICAVDPTPSDHGDNAGPDGAPGVEPSWLLGFIRADALALTAAVAVGATVLGLPALNLAFTAYAFSPDFPSANWTYLPLLVGAGIAVLAGGFGVYRAGVEAAPGWVRALAGMASLIGLVMTMGTVVAWILAPEVAPFFDYEPFDVPLE